MYTGFGAAIMSVNGTSFGNNFEVFGDSGSDGDIYILNGNLSISNSPVIWGSVYVPNGSLSMSNSSEIKGNVWSNGSASLTTVGGWAKSTTGNISGGSVGAGTPRRPGTITILGRRHEVPGHEPGPVPTQTFPQIANSTTAWTNAGYTLVGPYHGCVGLHERLRLHPQHRQRDVGDQRPHQHRGPDQCHVYVPERRTTTRTRSAATSR